ncbi:hypothetical protein DL771_012127 [Monosporascus sp. 5C6A]|nr:hypothetical protein DL771_012127 [Monosporascus sp. 5C6A]
MLRLTRGRSGSENSQASQPLLQGPDLYLPDHSNVFVTRTKSGKPAFARRKNDLLQDFGFDLLGQSFGVPSRADLERRSRYTHNASQSSGLITLPDTSQYPAGKPASNNEEPEPGPEELPLVVEKKNPNVRRPPTPPRGILKRPKDDAYFATHDGLGHPPMGYSHPSSMGFQPPPPPPGHFPCSKYWLGGSPPLNFSSYQHQPPQLLSHVPAYHPQVAYNGGTPSWVSPQAQAAPQYVNPLSYSGPETASVPILPTQHPYPPYPPYTAPAPYFMPGPPPPSLPPGFQGPRVASLRDNFPNLDTSKVKDAQVCHNPAATSPGGPRSNRSNGKSAEVNKIEDDTKVNRNVSKRIRHYHICAGCGKRRSSVYQKAHPLKRGEIPEPAYCARCIREADFSNSELSNSDAADDHSFIQRGLGTTRSASSSDDGYDVRCNRHASGKLRHRPREKVPGRLGLFSSIASKLRWRSQSLSSAEESGSRASSPIRVRNVRRRQRKHPSSSNSHVHSASKRGLPPQDHIVSGMAANIRKVPEAVVNTVSHGERIESSRKRNTNDSQESPTRSENTASAASLTIPKVAEIVLRAINDSKGSNSPIARALETGKTIVEEVLAPEPNKSRASYASSKEPPDIIKAGPRSKARPKPIEIPDPTASKLSSQSGSKESNLTSARSPVLPNTPRKDVDPCYQRPSVRNEGSELLTEHFDMGHKESNCTAANEPVFEEHTPKPHRQSPKDGCEQKDPIEQFIPFPESAKSTTFGAWDESQFPDPDDSPRDREFPSMWEPLTPTDPHMSGHAAFPRFMDDKEDS